MRKRFLLFFCSLMIGFIVTSVNPNQLVSHSEAQAQSLISAQRPLGTDSPPTFVTNQVIVKLKNGLPVNSGGLFTQPAIKAEYQLSEINLSRLPRALQNEHKKINIQNVKLIFAKADTPGKELEKLKRTAPPHRTINESGLLQIDLTKTVLMTFASDVSVQTLIEELKKDPDVIFAQPNYIIHLDQVNDPYFLDHYPTNMTNRDPTWNPAFDYQWNLKAIGMEPVLEQTIPNQVLVAVIDSGIDYTHPELGGCTLTQVNASQCPKIAPGIDYVNADTDPMDDYNHGTHVAGIISAQTNNGIGIAGISSNARILPLKVFNQNGSATNANILAAVYDAVSRGASVINASWGGTGTYPALSETFTFAYENGVALIAAAGNSGENAADSFPANITCATTQYPDRDCVLAVSATDFNNARAEYSNWGGAIDVAAPGGYYQDVLSLKSTAGRNDSYTIAGQYLRAAGTSMAAPHVSGLAALVLGLHPTFTPDEVRNSILNGATDLGSPGNDPIYGAGLINADKTLNSSDTTSRPVAKIDRPNLNYLNNPEYILFYGSAYGNQFVRYKIEYSNTLNNPVWSTAGITLYNNDGTTPQHNSILARANLPQLTSGVYYFRLTVETATYSTNFTYPVQIDTQIKSGFPVHFGSGPEEKPVIADINGDGLDEIIFKNGQDGLIEVLGGNGQPLSGWPQATGELYSAQDYPQTPVVTDFDPAYPGLEILLTVDYDGSGMQIIGFHADGTPISGWTINDWSSRERLDFPTEISTGTYQGQPFLLYPGSHPTYSSTVKIHLFDHEAHDFPGWPISVTVNDRTAFFAVADTFVADITGDTNPEVGFVFNGNTLFVYKIDGSLLTQVTMSNPNQRIEKLTIADVDGNGQPEMIGIVNTRVTNSSQVTNSQVYVWKADGSLLSTAWPKTIPIPPEDASTTYAVGLNAGDFNHDGKNDIMVGLNGTQQYWDKYYIFDAAGNILPGFPSNAYPAVESSINAAINSTQHLWIDQGFKISANLYDSITGVVTPVANFPKDFKTYTQQAHPGSVAFAQLDADPQPELVVPVMYGITASIADTQLYVFDLPLQLTSLDWPQYLHDANHSNAIPAERVINFDLNQDGSITTADLQLLLTNYRLSENGDFDGDGLVTMIDAARLRSKLSPP